MQSLHGAGSFDQKTYRRALMKSTAAKVAASPSQETAGRAILKQNPNSPGSLGIAISEAVEVAAQNPEINYALGSVLNHVLLHQTIIGLEALEQMELADDYPDVIVGCTGGGSNFSGIAFPFIGKKLHGDRDVRVIAVEPTACPSLPKAAAYDFGDTAQRLISKMHTLVSIHTARNSRRGQPPRDGLVSHLLDLEHRRRRCNSSFAAACSLLDPKPFYRLPRRIMPSPNDWQFRAEARRKSRAILAYAVTVLDMQSHMIMLPQTAV
jgi:tryptophan synthase beta chain